MLCVAILTVENADSALISSSVVGRADIWLRNAHRTGVRLEVILSLGLIQTVQKKSSLLREHVLRHEGNGVAGKVR